MDHFLVQIFSMLNFSVVVLFAHMGLQTLLTIRGNDEHLLASRYFVFLCMTIMAYGAAALLTVNYSGQNFKSVQFEIINAANMFSFFLYIMTLKNFLAIDSWWMKVSAGLAAAAGATQVFAGVWVLGGGQSLTAKPVPFETSNIILNAIGTETSPSDLLSGIFAIHFLNVLLTSVYLMSKVVKAWHTEWPLVIGLLFNILVYMNEFAIVAFDLKYVVPILPLSYIFESIRLNHSFQLQHGKRIHQLETMVYEASKRAELSSIAGGVLHDIRSPISVVQMTHHSISRRIEQGLLDAEWLRKKMEVLDRNTKSMTFIAAEYLKLLRGTVTTAPSTQNVRTVIENAIELSTRKLKENKVNEVQVECPQLTVSFHETQVALCLMNLISNAADAVQSLEQKWIRVEFSCEGSLGVFRVIDSGNGIPEDVQKKMFQPVYSTKSASKGTGLGLSLVRSMIEQVGGGVSVDATHPNTCLVLTCPVEMVARPTEVDQAPLERAVGA